ncbi:MAG: SDR family oxidoreductase [Lentisphaeria bacterium]|nr:SDR family oxidoreductase [Lentisphaeria bacterium]
MRFEGKRVLVTGSSRNTGLGIAEAFAREGAAVCIHGSSPENVLRASRRVREATGARVVEAVADLSTRTGVEGLFGTVRRELGGLDVLVNNAVQQGVGPEFVEVSDEMLESVVAVNILGYYRCGQEAARLMIANGVQGAIVNISSNTSERPPPGRTAYVASKGAIDALTRGMAIDLAPHGIRVNTVAPGYIFTERWEHLDAATSAQRRRTIPLGEPAAAADVAEAVLYLASPAAGNITGARLVIDGGVSVQFVPRGTLP